MLSKSTFNERTRGNRTCLSGLTTAWTVLNCGISKTHSHLLTLRVLRNLAWGLSCDKPWGRPRPDSLPGTVWVQALSIEDAEDRLTLCSFMNSYLYSRYISASPVVGLTPC